MSRIIRWKEGENDGNKRRAEPDFRRRDAGHDTRRKGHQPRKECKEPSFTRKD